MFDMMKQAAAMQAKMKLFQDEMEKTLFTGSAGAGAVTLEMTGKYEVRKVTLRPTSVDPKDIEMLQDLIQTAFNDASRQVKEKMRAGVSKMTGGISLPPGISF